MIHEGGARTPYEVYCGHCRVTFPLGTKRCLHCGGHLGRDRTHRELVFPPPVGDESRDAEAPNPAAKISRLTAPLWLLLALGVMLYRSCT